MEDGALTFPSATEEDRGSSNVAMFLSLFLLILAFFILLVAISTFEKVKSEAVMDSLSSTFTKVLQTDRDPTERSANDGSILAGHQFQDQVTDLFATTLQVAKVTVVQPGRLMRVSVPTASMFAPGEEEVRSGIIPLLDRIVASLSGRPPGLHFEMEFVMGVDLTDKGELPITKTLGLSRVSGVAQAMAERGVPPDAISIGLQARDPSTVVISFYVRDEDEQQFRYLVPDPELEDDL